ncbi:MAG: transporter [Clostridiaceae bacterium]|jgi:MFS family permease|nr:transporter [Clostridiaceae bacterium]
MTGKRNLSLYLIGRFISLIGTGIQQIALPLFILDLTHSGIMMGVFSMLCLVPNLVTSPFAGILGDRKNRRNLMVVTDFGRGTLICILGLLAMSGSLNIYILFISQILISIMDSIFGGASVALLPELLSEDELMKAMSIRGALDAVSMIIGPALGGIIYGFFGIKVVFYLNGISFFISGICSLAIMYEAKVYDKGKITLRSFFTENKEVLSLIKKSKGLMQLFAFAMITNLLMSPLFDIVIPYVMKKGIGFSSQQYGYIITAFMVGILIGNLALGFFAGKFKTKFLMNSGFILEMIMFLALTITVFPKIVNKLGGHSWTLFIILSFICLSTGIFNAAVNTPLNTNLQKMVSNDMRSRFFSLLGVFSQGAVPLGAIIYGILLDKFHYFNIMLVITILSSAITIYFIIKAVPEVYDPKPIENNTKMEQESIMPAQVEIP